LGLVWRPSWSTPKRLHPQQFPICSSTPKGLPHSTSPRFK
jgi:hypothetical protein